ncbi:hypothetical protein LCGC14_1389180 [marine sediment metagenome]|uniref:Uncharacterized protein n=1 Tax=marine sediment metagenome TaxID=412755 RepID=A0A0F9K0N5_9ZZZZ
MVSEQELAELEEQIENMDSSDLAASYGSPEPKKKDNVYKFFREILKLKETWKVGNLRETEIGLAKISIRGNLEIAQYSKIEGLDTISDYFEERARMIAATSMGRKGFLAQLFVTQIRKEQKLKTPMPEKKRLFGKPTPEEQNE